MPESKRTMGLVGATGVGVGAIVGGGILALAGVAFMTTGPGALLAFSINGVVAVITALSFAELATRFPESGGTYTFAKKVLTVEAAFAVGWVVWFASIVAAVLYAIGFAAFAVPIVRETWIVLSGTAPEALDGVGFRKLLAAVATGVFALTLIRRGGGGGAWINVAKILVFSVLIAGGLHALSVSPSGTLKATMTPFMPEGVGGLIRAMGFTFIALQGFDLIAAVAGEVRDPSRTIPRAMLLSLATALAIYIPLLLVVAAVGVGPDTTIQAESTRLPETIVAVAAGNFLGSFGYWLVIVAAVLSMLSALQANLFAASRVAMAMAEDRTLPEILDRRHARSGAPSTAVIATAIIVIAIVAAVPDVAAAGAAASLIFLTTFALTQGTNVLARRRSIVSGPVFLTPFFPALPIVGGLICVALAVFQAVTVPEAGRIAGLWLGIGGVLFITLFGRRARVRDAASQALDPSLQRLRGRSPLVLVPIANPVHAASKVEVANALSAPGVGRVLLLNIVTTADDVRERDERLGDALASLRTSLVTAFDAGLAPEALTTVAGSVWPEITRVARTHDCESLLLGLSNLEQHETGSPLEQLMGDVGRDTVVLRASSAWRLSNARRVLVPVAGGGHHDVLRARLVGTLCRDADREITYLRIVPPGTSDEECARRTRSVQRLVRDEARGRARVELVVSDSVTDTVATMAAEHDLIILGLQRHGRRRKLFGDLALRVARDTTCAIIMMSRRG